MTYVLTHQNYSTIIHDLYYKIKAGFSIINLLIEKEFHTNLRFNNKNTSDNESLI